MGPTTKNVKLIGKLEFDPQIREIAKDRYTARLVITTKDRYIDQHEKEVEDVQSHTIVAWGSVAKLVYEQLKKGMTIQLHGRIVHRSYSDVRGMKKYLTEIIMNEFTVLPDEPPTT